MADLRKLRLKESRKLFETRKTSGTHIEVVLGQTQVYASCWRWNQIVALSRTDLAEEWRLTPPEQPNMERNGGLCVMTEWDDSTLLVANMAVRGALDRQSRELLWSAESAVGWICWQNQAFFFEGDRRRLVRVDVHTGSRACVLELAKEVAGAATCGPMLVCKSSSASDAGGLFQGVDLATGSVRWERDVIGEVRARYDGVEYLSTCGHCSVPGIFIATGGDFTVGCSSDTGDVVWVARVPVTYYTPLVEGGRIPIVTPTEFVVLDEATGSVLVRREHGLTGVVHVKRGALRGETFVTVSESGDVLLFDMRDGALLWRKRVRGSLWDTVWVDDRLLVPDSSGKLWVFEGA